MALMPDYNKVARVYDFLAKIVFGETLEVAKQSNLDNLVHGDRVLVVGGGSGSILEYLSKQGLTLEVDFVELSGKMLDLAKKRNIDNLKVNYFNTNILEHEKGGYSVVITNFFFDQFTQSVAERLLIKIIALLDKEGRVLIADYIKSSRMMDQFLLWCMYTFFRITTNIGKVQLIDIKTLFERNGLVQVKSKKINSCVVSEVYRINLNTLY